MTYHVFRIESNGGLSYMSSAAEAVDEAAAVRLWGMEGDRLIVLENNPIGHQICPNPNGRRPQVFRMVSGEPQPICLR